MATFVHRKNTSDGPRYRVWNTVVDVYETAPLTRAEVAQYLDRRDFHGGAEERLARTDASGTSSLRGDTRDMDGPWDVERCEGKGGCGRFHHAYAEGVNGCSWCGEARSDKGHAPPCLGERETR